LCWENTTLTILELEYGWLALFLIVKSTNTTKIVTFLP
jgi:hypothetical protein